MVKIKKSNNPNNPNKRTADNPSLNLVNKGWLVLGVFLFALLATPFLTDNNNKFSGKVVASTKTIIKENPRGILDETFNNIITNLGDENHANAFISCKEEKGRVTFEYQATRVSGKNTKPQEYQTIYYPGCEGDNFVKFACVLYSNHQYTLTGKLLGDEVEIDNKEYTDTTNNIRNKNLRNDADKRPFLVQGKRNGPSQITTKCPKGCLNKECVE